MILGTISAVDDENGLKLIIDGEEEPTTKKYTYMASYVPKEKDRVLIEEISGSYVILGKIISETAESGRVNFASNAANADNATNAENAANADNAENAKNAEQAEKATLADNATNATSAENANKASNAENAEKAENANYATTAGTANKLSASAVQSSPLTNLVQVRTAYSSAIGGNYVTDVSVNFTNVITSILTG